MSSGNTRSDDSGPPRWPGLVASACMLTVLLVGLYGSRDRAERTDSNPPPSGQLQLQGATWPARDVLWPAPAEYHVPPKPSELGKLLDRLDDEDSRAVVQAGEDVDCQNIGHPVEVEPGDPHRLDGDGDGIGCEGW